MLRASEETVFVRNKLTEIMRPREFLIRYSRSQLSLLRPHLLHYFRSGPVFLLVRLSLNSALPCVSIHFAPVSHRFVNFSFDVSSGARDDIISATDLHRVETGRTL